MGKRNLTNPAGKRLLSGVHSNMLLQVGTRRKAALAKLTRELHVFWLEMSLHVPFQIDDKLPADLTGLLRHSASFVTHSLVPHHIGRCAKLLETNVALEFLLLQMNDSNVLLQIGSEAKCLPASVALKRVLGCLVVNLSMKHHVSARGKYFPANFAGARLETFLIRRTMFILDVSVQVNSPENLPANRTRGADLVLRARAFFGRPVHVLHVKTHVRFGDDPSADVAGDFLRIVILPPFLFLQCAFWVGITTWPTPTPFLACSNFRFRIPFLAGSNFRFRIELHPFESDDTFQRNAVLLTTRNFFGVQTLFQHEPADFRRTIHLRSKKSRLYICCYFESAFL